MNSPSRQSPPDSENPRLTNLLSYLKQDLDNAALRQDIFQTAINTKKLDIAAEQISYAKRISPLSKAWQFNEATLYLAQKRWNEAESIFAMLITEVGPQPAFSEGLAWVAFYKQDYQRCYEILDRLGLTEEIGPAPPALQNLWLRTLHHLGHLTLAMEWTRKRKAANTVSAEAGGIASLIAFDLNFLSEAGDWANIATLANETSQESKLTLSALALQNGNALTAGQLATDVLQLDSANGRAWSLLGMAHLTNHDLVAARECLVRAASLMPLHIGTLHGLGWSWIADKHYEEAEKAFTTALSLDDNFGETHGALAVIAALQGNVAEAKERVRRALGLDKAGLAARYAQALVDGSIHDQRSVQDLHRKLMASFARRHQKNPQ